MENKNILNIVIVLTVGVILAGSLLMPVISDATTTERTYTNEGVYYMTDDPTDYVLEFRGTDQQIIVNDELVTTFADLPNSAWTLISTPEYLIRMQGPSSNYACWITSITGTNNYIGSTTTESATVILTDSTITIGSSVFDYTGEFRGIAKTGNYVMTPTGGFVVSDTDTIIIGNGATTVTHWYDAFYIIGTVDDIQVSTSDSITVSNVTVHANEIMGFNGSIVNDISFVATDGTTTVDATYNRVIVPAEVTIDKTVKLTPGEIALINTIPVMVIVALLMVAVGGLYLRRND